METARATYRFITQLFAAKLIFSFTMYAGFFGIFDFISPTQAPLVQEKTYTVQTVPLLESVPNPHAQGGVGGAEIIIVDGSALYPETGNGSSASVTPSDFAQQGDKISTYVVQDGDTISQIAGMFRVSTNTIRWGNDIDADGIIQPGDRLVILPINGVRHTVAKGDTLKSIAEKYEGDINEILQYNELSAGAEVVVGEVVVIPNGEVHTPKPAPKNASGSYAKATISGAGYFSNPVPGSVLTQHLHGYNAVDLGARVGTPIYAAASGEVIVSKQGGWNGGYGNYIVIKHANGTQTLYSHNSSNAVYVGQYVEQGELIGYVGQSGRATGPHVHFEVRGATNPLD